MHFTTYVHGPPEIPFRCVFSVETPSHSPSTPNFYQELEYLHLRFSKFPLHLFPPLLSGANFANRMHTASLSLIDSLG